MTQTRRNELTKFLFFKFSIIGAFVASLGMWGVAAYGEETYKGYGITKSQFDLWVETDVPPEELTRKKLQPLLDLVDEFLESVDYPDYIEDDFRRHAEANILRHRLVLDDFLNMAIAPKAHVVVTNQVRFRQDLESFWLNKGIPTARGFPHSYSRQHSLNAATLWAFQQYYYNKDYTRAIKRRKLPDFSGFSEDRMIKKWRTPIRVAKTGNEFVDDQILKITMQLSWVEGLPVNPDDQLTDVQDANVLIILPEKMWTCQEKACRDKDRIPVGLTNNDTAIRYGGNSLAKRVRRDDPMPEQARLRFGDKYDYYRDATLFTPNAFGAVHGFLLSNAKHEVEAAVCELETRNRLEDYLRERVTECLIRAMGLPGPSKYAKLTGKRSRLFSVRQSEDWYPRVGKTWEALSRESTLANQFQAPFQDIHYTQMYQLAFLYQDEIAAGSTEEEIRHLLQFEPDLKRITRKKQDG